MMSYMQDDALIAAQLLTPDSIALTPAQVSQAIELAHQATTEAEQWQTYLNGLALIGLQIWLEQRSSQLKLESQFLQAGALQAGALQAGAVKSEPALSQQVSQLQISQSRLHLLITDCLADPLVAAPQLTAAAQPDFYLLIEVLEELSEVRLRGYLPQAKFNAIQLEAQLNPPSTPDLLFLPIEAFDADPAGLLLRLRAQLTAAQLRQPAIQPAISLAPQKAPQTAINLRLWLQDRLDQVAEALSWQLLPPAALNLSGALMSGNADLLNAVLRELQSQRGVAIPTSVRAAERDLEIEDLSLKLYALTWEPAPDQWSLLLILGAQPHCGLPVGLTLRLEANQELLVEERLSDSPYLYSLVVGETDEQFCVTVTSPTGAALKLTPFGFAPLQDSAKS